MVSYQFNIFTPLLLFVFTSVLAGQANFRAGYELNNPAPSASELPTEERLAIHQKWLKEAELKNDTLLRIFGEIYLFYDYVRLNDLATASTHIVMAEHLAEASGNRGWQGGVAFRRGNLHTYLREPEKGLISVKQAYEWCANAGDSLCVAESLQSISATYAFMDSFDLAHHYFEQALPMLRKFGAKNQLKTALGNYGSLLTSEGKPWEAIPYLEEAKSLAEELGDLRSVGLSMHNLANAYRFTGNTSKAINGFKEAMVHNKKHGFYDRVIRNYAGLRQSYQEIEDYKSAIDYQEKFYHLQDSLIGSKTKIRIAELEAQFLESEQALDLKQSEQALLISRQHLERGGILLLLILLSTLLGGLWWWRQNKQHQAIMAENRKNLGVVSRLLSEKNEAIMRLKEQAKIVDPVNAIGEETTPSSEVADADDEQYLNLFDKSILTNNDWSDFKASFEKSFPSYVKRLRDSFPAITESEERLFLLLKLKMTSKEISNLLGISVSSVKKTRNRLRKKLPLKPDDGLEDFVQNFQMKKIGLTVQSTT